MLWIQATYFYDTFEAAFLGMVLGISKFVAVLFKGKDASVQTLGVRFVCLMSYGVVGVCAHWVKLQSSLANFGHDLYDEKIAPCTQSKAAFAKANEHCFNSKSI